MRRLPPPRTKEPAFDAGEGFPYEARVAIQAGEQALVSLRESPFKWYLVGGACFMLRNVSLARSGANAPTGARYRRVYNVLVNSWPELAKLHKGVRSDSIWLFENREPVLAWLKTLPQKDCDRWTHPSVIRRHYERRHPNLPDKTPPPWRDRNRHRRVWNREKLGELSREDLEALIGELGEQLADRERHIIELEELLTEKDREIARLRNDLVWERTARMQLEAAAAPAAAPVTAIRPDGGTAEIVHAISRESQAITPPESHGRPDYRSWAGLVAERIKALSALELYWLLADNAPYIDAYEKALPGAGIGLKNRINARIAELEASP